MSNDITVLQRTQVINVDPASGAVSVVNAGPVGPGADPTLVPRMDTLEGDMANLEAAETTISALPAADPIEGDELVPIDQGGVTKKMTIGRLMRQKNGVISGGGSVANTTTETTIITWSFGADEMEHESTIRYTIMGAVLNNTGVSRTTTLRLKSNGTTCFTWIITQATNGTRRFSLDLPLIVVNIGFLLALGDGRRYVANPAGTAYEENLPAAVSGVGVPLTAHNWTLTAQHSFASTDLSVTPLALCAVAT